MEQRVKLTVFSWFRRQQRLRCAPERSVRNCIRKHPRVAGAASAIEWSTRLLGQRAQVFICVEFLYPTVSVAQPPCWRMVICPPKALLTAMFAQIPLQPLLCSLFSATVCLSTWLLAVEHERDRQQTVVDAVRPSDLSSAHGPAGGHQRTRCRLSTVYVAAVARLPCWRKRLGRT